MNLLELVIICAGNTNFVLYNVSLQCLLYVLTHGFVSVKLYCNIPKEYYLN